MRRLRIKASDFEVKDVIGRGHFGEVQVVREKHTETVYAMKTLRKQETLSQPEVCWSVFTEAFKRTMSHCMGKPTICIGKNKGADQLRGTAKLITPLFSLHG